MKKGSFLGALFLVLPLTPIAASDAILLIGNVQKQGESRSVVSGQASAIINASAAAGEMNVSASEIAYDDGGNTLECSGDVTVTAAGRTIKGKALTIDLGAGPRKIFFLNPAGINQGAKPAPVSATTVTPVGPAVPAPAAP